MFSDGLACHGPIVGFGFRAEALGLLGFARLGSLPSALEARKPRS